MFFFKKKKAFYQRKRVVIPVILLVVLVAIRIALPTIIRIRLNSYLKDFSPTLRGHVVDVDLAILRGVYTLKGVTWDFKENDEQFLKVKSLEISIAWRDIFHGKPIIDFIADEADISYSERLIPAIKKHIKSVKEKTKDEKKSSIIIGRFDFINSNIRTSLFPLVSAKQRVVITKLESRWTNLTPTKESPTLPFSLQGALADSGYLKIEGEANFAGENSRWTLDGEITDFDLTRLNPYLVKKLPLTFTRGKLNLYAEAMIDGGPMKGYLKPFITGLDVVRTNEKFLGPKHWLIEIISALGNMTMKSDQTMATRIPFVIDDGFKIEGGAAISKAIEHGFKKELSRGIENSVGFKKEL